MNVATRSSIVKGRCGAEGCFQRCQMCVKWVPR